MLTGRAACDGKRGISDLRTHCAVSVLRSGRRLEIAGSESVPARSGFDDESEVESVGAGWPAAAAAASRGQLDEGSSVFGRGWAAECARLTRGRGPIPWPPVLVPSLCGLQCR